MLLQFNARELVQCEMRSPTLRAMDGHLLVDKATSCHAQNDVHTIEE